MKKKWFLNRYTIGAVLVLFIALAILPQFFIPKPLWGSLANLVTTPQPLAAESNPTFHRACYIQGANSRWAIVIPHWGDGEMVYALSLTDGNAVPFLVTQHEFNQWEWLASEGSHVAVVTGDDGKWGLEIYDLVTRQKVAEFVVGYGMIVDDLSSTGAIIHDYGGWETTPRGFYVDFNRLDEGAQPMFVDITEHEREEIPAATEAMIHQRFATLCNNWPGFAPNPAPASSVVPTSPTPVLPPTP